VSRRRPPPPCRRRSAATPATSDVADRWGNLVSATPSGGWLQSSPVVPELGFPLGTRAQMFWLEPGLPSSLRPRRAAADDAVAVAGAAGRRAVARLRHPGGDQQDQWQLLFALRAIHGPRGVGQALQARSTRRCCSPSTSSRRSTRGGGRRAGWRSRTAGRPRRWPRCGAWGTTSTCAAWWTLGRQSAVARDGEWLRAAADARGAQGLAVGR
jgi:gamma-glutamyltranspeptidase/glutathione hydrolase